MKKKILAIGVIFALLVGSITVSAAPRWTYFGITAQSITMHADGIHWSGSADTYSSSIVTSTKVTVKLQVSTAAGWGTIETLSDTDKNYTGTGNTYTKWGAGKAYRTSLEAWCYDGTKQLEHVGPFYEYLDT